VKSNNKNPDLLLEDGEPVTCHFMAKADAPIFHERCEQNATEIVSEEVVERFKIWQDDHKDHIIYLYPGTPYLCDVHAGIIKETAWSF